MTLSPMAWPHARFAECRNAIERMAALGVKKTDASGTAVAVKAKADSSGEQKRNGL